MHAIHFSICLPSFLSFPNFSYLGHRFVSSLKLEAWHSLAFKKKQGNFLVQSPEQYAQILLRTGQLGNIAILAFVKPRVVHMPFGSGLVFSYNCGIQWCSPIRVLLDQGWHCNRQSVTILFYVVACTVQRGNAWKTVVPIWRSDLVCPQRKERRGVSPG